MGYVNYDCPHPRVPRERCKECHRIRSRRLPSVGPGKGHRASPETKQQAVELRQQGMTFVQIADVLGCAVSTAHLWAREER
jgi:transposase-like protein